MTTIFGPEWPDAPMRVLKNRAVARFGQGNMPPKHPIGETSVIVRTISTKCRSTVPPCYRPRKREAIMRRCSSAAGAGVAEAVRSIEACVEQIVQGLMTDAWALIR